MQTAVPPPASVASGRRIHVSTLTGSDVDALRLGWQTRHDADEIRRILELYPGRSVWIPETLEFGVVGPWRRRDEIAVVQELSAVRHPDRIVDAIVDRCDAAEADLVVMVELDETRRPIFYERVGFELMEEIITYELIRSGHPTMPTLQTTFLRVDPLDEPTLAVLRDMDHQAFPWLWWNNDLEFQAYGLLPGVELYLGFRQEAPVSYVGLTLYPGWGHLDRIAVVPTRQGEGIGWETLAFAVGSLFRRGARSVGLSTQRDNHRSRRLYERFGFRRSRSNDYRLYGRTLREPADQMRMPGRANTDDWRA